MRTAVERKKSLEYICPSSKKGYFRRPVLGGNKRASGTVREAAPLETAVKAAD